MGRFSGNWTNRLNQKLSHANTVYCEFCGRQIEDNATFCSQCGRNLVYTVHRANPVQKPEPARSSPAGTLSGLGILVIFGALGIYFLEYSSCGGFLASLCQVNVQNQYFGLMEVCVAIGALFLALGVMIHISNRNR